MTDKMQIEIAEDGQIKIETEGISDANHCNADEFLEEAEKMLGGRRGREKKKQGSCRVRTKRGILDFDY